MDLNLALANLLSPPILFFFLGMAAVALRSDLEIPQPIPKMLALYLLLAIGFRGGVELRHGGIDAQIALTLAAAVFMAIVVPLYCYAILRRRLDAENAAAVAAAYGSVSAVTFVTAGASLTYLGIPYGGHMVAALALMESPAIVIGVVLARRAVPGRAGEGMWSELLRDAFFNGSVFLLMGSLVVGFASGDAGHEALRPFVDDLFKGVLAVFLLDMGLLAARRLSDLKPAGIFLSGFALVLPLANAGIGLAIAYGIGLTPGDALMFVVLCASASYIAVPAAMRLAVPGANPSLYVPMALAITFPFNIVVGIPLFLYLIGRFWG